MVLLHHFMKRKRLDGEFTYIFGWTIHLSLQFLWSISLIPPCFLFILSAYTVRIIFWMQNKLKYLSFYGKKPTYTSTYCIMHHSDCIMEHTVSQIDGIRDVCICKFNQTQAHDGLHNLDWAQTQSDTNAPHALVDLQQ